MRTELILPMMMFGTFTKKRAKKDDEGKPIKKNGKYVYEKYKIKHVEEAGDAGIYPSVNHIYKRTRNGRQVLSDPAQQLFEKWEGFSQIWAYENDWELTDDKVVVEVDTYFPHDNKNRDAHNAIKLMMDALEGVIYKNDAKALPRMIDNHKVSKDESPYFKLYIYKKDEENEVIKERYGIPG